MPRDKRQLFVYPIDDKKIYEITSLAAKGIGVDLPSRL